MKNLILTILGLTLLSTCIAQGDSESNLDQLQSIDSFTFYGYDISKAKVRDPKRAGQPLADYMNELIGEMMAKLDEERMKKWFGIDLIDFDITPTYQANSSTKHEDLFYPNYLPNVELTREDITEMVKSYQISVSSGIGFVVIYENFSRERKSVSGYGCFFDVRTREPLTIIHYEAKDGNSYRSFRDYWTPAFALVKEFADVYKMANGKRR
jgi:hypothetical protein